MKKTIGFLFFATLMIVGLTSCVTYISLEPEANRYWVDRSRAELISTYGAPDRETSDGMGGVILIYEQTETTVDTYSNVDPGFGFVYDGLYGFYYDMLEPPMRTYSTRTETRTDYAHFYINPENRVYKVVTNLQRPK